jgi:anti-anti-sigma factor
VNGDSHGVPGPDFSVDTVMTGAGMLTTTVAGEIDMVTSSQLAAELDRAIARAPDALVIDLADVQFCDSRGLSTLVEANTACLMAGIELSVLPSARVRRVLEITGLAPVLPTTRGSGE